MSDEFIENDIEAQQSQKHQGTVDANNVGYTSAMSSGVSQMSGAHSSSLMLENAVRLQHGMMPVSQSNLSYSVSKMLKKTKYKNRFRTKFRE